MVFSLQTTFVGANLTNPLSHSYDVVYICIYLTGILSAGVSGEH